MVVLIPGFNYVVLNPIAPPPSGIDPSVPKVSEFDVYTTPQQSGIEIRWDKLPNTVVDKYRIYRSIDQTPVFESLEDLELVAEVNGDIYSYLHLSGTQNDYYTISTITGTQESSLLEPLTSSQDYVPAMCTIKGQIIDLQGARLADVKVSAKLIVPPKTSGNSLISAKSNYVLSGEDGKFELKVLQGAEVILMIDEVRVSDPIKVPNQPSIDYTELDIFEEYRFEDRPYA